MLINAYYLTLLNYPLLFDVHSKFISYIQYKLSYNIYLMYLSQSNFIDELLQDLQRNNILFLNNPNDISTVKSGVISYLVTGFTTFYFDIDLFFIIIS